MDNGLESLKQFNLFTSLVPRQAITSSCYQHSRHSFPDESYSLSNHHLAASYIYTLATELPGVMRSGYLSFPSPLHSSLIGGN